ncbi:MAG TPA: Phenylacetic acid catabolic protein [Candidatus Dormibacteraeota bacterium]
MGFARVLYGLLEQISAPDKPVPLVRGADRELRYCVSYLDHPFDSWAMVVTALAVIDPALTVMCEVAARSPYNPLAVRAGRILDEESFHDRVRGTCLSCLRPDIPPAPHVDSSCARSTVGNALI